MPCHPAGSPACQDAVNNFNGIANFLSNGIIVQVLPVLIGALVGTLLLAEEMETGTFQWIEGGWLLALSLLLLAATVWLVRRRAT